MIKRRYKWRGYAIWNIVSEYNFLPSRGILDRWVVVHPYNDTFVYFSDTKQACREYIDEHLTSLLIRY